MTKYKVKKSPLSENGILKALGSSDDFTVDAKKEFARDLIKELERMFLASSTAFPDKEVSADLIDDLKKLKKLAIKLNRSSQKSTYVQSLLSLCGRAICKKQYNNFDMEDIIALTNIALQAADHVRFNKKNSGPDDRLAQEVALVIARHYKIAFKKMPGFSRQEKGEDTPYGRICRTVADIKGIRIGNTTQEKAIEMLKLKKAAPFEFFSLKPYVSILKEKSLN